MKILLVAINAKYIHSNLAVYSLRAYAEKCGYRADMAEYTINHRTDHMLQEIYGKHPDVLVFSSYIWNIGYVRELAEEFHKLRPGVPIWAGGPEVSFETERFLRDNPAFFGVMSGEGERTFARLCAYYAGCGSLEEIPGVSYREADGKITVRPAGEPLDMDELPFCYDSLEGLENRIIYYESSRGCPFSCTYCLSSVDRVLRFRSLDLVFRELQYFLDREVPQVKFVDRTFNCRREHALAVWRYIRDHDNGKTNFHFEISADLLNEEDLELLSGMRPGLVQFEIGVQSVNPDTLAAIRRRMDLRRLEENVRRISRMHRIHQHLDLIAGLPGEDLASFRRSFQEIYALKPQQLQLGFLKVLKGSGMYEQAAAYGLVYRTNPPYEVLATRWLSYDEMIRIHLAEEMLEIHYNSGLFLTSLALLEQAFSDAFSMYLKLGLFYRERGLSGMSHSRVRRSEIFLEFARTVDGGREELYKEALIFDLYKREKSKSRPAWAADLTPYRKQMAACLRKNVPERSCCHLEPFFHLRPLEKNGELPGTAQSCLPGTAGQGQPGGAEKLSKEAGEPVQWVLFDYGRRDALTNEAAMRAVSVGEEDIYVGKQTGGDLHRG